MKSWCLRAFLALFLVSVGLTGCASANNMPAVTQGAEIPNQNLSSWLKDLPLPPGATIRADQTSVVGIGDQWVGRVVLNVGRDVDASYQFFLNAYPEQGWTVVSSQRGSNSHMVLIQEDRIATIKWLDDRHLAGTSVSLTMALRNADLFEAKK